MVCFAAGVLGLSGLLEWAASGAVDGDGALARALADLTFATGGPGHVVPLALLVAGVAGTRAAGPAGVGAAVPPEPETTPARSPA